MNVNFNIPYLTGKEGEYIQESIRSGKISGDGIFSKKCHDFFCDRYGFKKCLLTTSCTDALEMAAILANIQPGDEVIAPSYTFVSTVNAFVLRGAKIVFADSEGSNPNIDVNKLEQLVSAKTKIIIAVHYAGVACDMDGIMAIARKHNIFIVEDCAQAIDSFYKGQVLGTFGHLAAFSFHETKNIMSGEGGLLVINDERLFLRAEIIREKGTNRSAFFRGEIDKYGWVDIGSSFLPSDMIAAFLYAQLECLDAIQKKRKAIWQNYYDRLLELEQRGFLKLPFFPDYSTNNAHMFYLLCKDAKERELLIKSLRGNGIYAVFHYLSLHTSPYYLDKHDGRVLENADRYSDTLVRLPMYYQLQEEQVSFVTRKIGDFYMK